MQGKMVRFILPLPARDEKQFTEYVSRGKLWARTDDAARKLYEQAVKQRWRAISLIIKAKLEAVETGITTFEDEFLAHIMLPNGMTAGEWLKPQVEKAYRIGTMPSMLPMLEGPKK